MQNVLRDSAKKQHPRSPFCIKWGLVYIGQTLKKADQIRSIVFSGIRVGYHKSELWTTLWALNILILPTDLK